MYMYFIKVPGLPANVYCPDVSFTTVKIVWSPPRQPNGIILGYSLSYQQINDNDITSLDELGSDRRDHFVSGLIKGKKYLFYLKARTSVGWGNALEFAVVMTIERSKFTLNNCHDCRNIVNLMYNYCYDDKSVSEII